MLFLHCTAAVFRFACCTIQPTRMRPTSNLHIRTLILLELLKFKCASKNKRDYITVQILKGRSALFIFEKMHDSECENGWKKDEDEECCAEGAQRERERKGVSWRSDNKRYITESLIKSSSGWTIPTHAMHCSRGLLLDTFRQTEKLADRSTFN